MGRLRLQPGSSPLRAEHDRLLRVALRRAKRPPEATGLVGTYSPRAIELAVASWRLRALHEHQSSAVFARLLPQLIEAEASIEYETTVLRMAMDEIHHAALCASVVELLGADPTVEADLATKPLPEHADASRLECALRNVMFVGCMSETIALALLTEERELTTEPAIRHVVAQLAADETLHAKLGWSFLAETWPRLDDAARERMTRYLPVALGYLEHEMLGAMPLPRDPPSADVAEEARALGVLDAREARALLYEVIAAVVLPRLEDHGLPAQEAWTARRHPRGSARSEIEHARSDQRT